MEWNVQDFTLPGSWGGVLGILYLPRVGLKKKLIFSAHLQTFINVWELLVGENGTPICKISSQKDSVHNHYIDPEYEYWSNIGFLNIWNNDNYDLPVIWIWISFSLVHIPTQHILPNYNFIAGSKYFHIDLSSCSDVSHAYNSYSVSHKGRLHPLKFYENLTLLLFFPMQLILEKFMIEYTLCLNSSYL